MFPSAVFHLPESPKSPLSSSHGKDGSVRKYLEKIVEPQLRERKSFDRRSTAASTRSAEDESTTTFSSLSTVFSFAEFASSQARISSEAQVLILLIKRARDDVAEAMRLYTTHVVSDYLESWPDKKTWIDTILLDIQRALNDLGTFMESVRIGGDDGGAVSLRRKFEWVLNHHKKLISKQQYLTLCHQSLMSAIQVMQAAEMNNSGPDQIFEAPARPWMRDVKRDVLRSPYSRQKWRFSQRNLSLPSITVSEADIDKVESKALNMAPLELPGSTPDDLPDPNNWDLYAPPPRPKTADTVAPQTGVEGGEHVGHDEQTQSDRRAHDRTSRSPANSPQLQNQMETIPLRRSLDQVRPRAPYVELKPRVSLDLVRPRAYSDQIRPRVAVEPKPRASVDVIRPMPTVNEKPIERNDSTSSTVIGVPLLGKRYRPQEIHVRKTPTKHNSLPSQLPSLPSHTSLFTDLSQWMLPSTARESYQSTSTTTSLDPSTPSTSVTSSPTVPTSPATGFNTAKGSSSVAPIPEHPKTSSVGSLDNDASTSQNDASPQPTRPPTQSPLVTTDPNSSEKPRTNQSQDHTPNSPEGSIASPHSLKRRPMRTGARKKPNLGHTTLIHPNKNSVSPSAETTNQPVPERVPLSDVTSSKAHEIPVEDIDPASIPLPESPRVEKKDVISSASQDVQQDISHPASQKDTMNEPASPSQKEVVPIEDRKEPDSPAHKEVFVSPGAAPVPTIAKQPSTSNLSAVSQGFEQARESQSKGEEQASSLPPQSDASASSSTVVLAQPVEEIVVSPPAHPPPSPPAVPSENLAKKDATGTEGEPEMHPSVPSAPRRQMTAQEKRRRALARRMEIAYGEK